MANNANLALPTSAIKGNPIIPDVVVNDLRTVNLRQEADDLIAIGAEEQKIQQGLKRGLIMDYVSAIKDATIVAEEVKETDLKPGEISLAAEVARLKARGRGQGDLNKIAKVAISMGYASTLQNKVIKF